MDLTIKKCVPCEGNIKPFSEKEAKKYLRDVKGWKLEKNKVLKISKEIKFRNFVLAMKYINKVAKLAEREQHHPDILIYSWNRVKVMTYTHAIGGLSENDFILAAKINKIKN